MADTQTGPFGQEARSHHARAPQSRPLAVPPGPRVAIVGTRHSTPYGEAVAEHIAEDLAAQGSA